MRYAIISDIHGNLEALTAALETIDQRQAPRIVCLGDVVGYGASPDECVSLIRGRGIPTILGNHDAVACGLEEPWGFNQVALSAVKWTAEQLSPENTAWLRALPMNLEYESFLAVHATPEESDWDYMFSWEETLPYLARLREKNHRLCFFGHTHCPGIFSEDGVYALDDDSRFVLDRQGLSSIPARWGSPATTTPAPPWASSIPAPGNSSWYACPMRSTRPRNAFSMPAFPDSSPNACTWVTESGPGAALVVQIPQKPPEPLLVPHGVQVRFRLEDASRGYAGMRAGAFEPAAAEVGMPLEGADARQTPRPAPFLGLFKAQQQVPGLGKQVGPRRALRHTRLKEMDFRMLQQFAHNHSVTRETQAARAAHRGQGVPRPCKRLPKRFLC